MAKKSKIAKNLQRIAKSERFRERRAALKAIIISPSASEDEKHEARVKLQKMPRDASPIRVRMRCLITGRPRGNFRKFGICRNMLRDMALRGEIPGVRKASW
jgi:small subunit ribosomal protein S14